MAVCQDEKMPKMTFKVFYKAVEKLLTINQLSELIQVSRKTLYQWTHTGFIPYYKLPKGVRFKVSEVERWLKIRRRKVRATYKITL